MVDKPAGLATMGVGRGEESLVTRLKDYIKRKHAKPGNVYLGVVSRLDSPVSGIVVLARTSKAAARLTEQFRARAVEKEYWAVVSGAPPAEGECQDWLVHDETARKVKTAARTRAGAQEARLTFQRLEQLGRHWLLAVRLETGRKHQIRVQLGARGWPIVGDKRYGSAAPFAPGIALHARRLRFAHPVGGARLEFTAPPPASWRKLGLSAGG